MLATIAKGNDSRLALQTRWGEVESPRGNLLGQYNRSLDEKSRLAIPSELRESLGARAILARSFDSCLCLYPEAKWQRIAEAVDDLPHVRHDARDLARLVFSGAALCELDRHGRISIPAFLREHACITADVVIVGVNGHAEIWDQESWIKERRKFEREAARLAPVLNLAGA